METRVLKIARIERLRCPKHLIALARYFKDDRSTANAVRDRILSTVYEWHMDGGSVLTASGVELDVGRSEYSGEAYMYSTRGETVYLDRDCSVKLCRIDDVFGADTRRTLNRIFARSEGVGLYRVQYRQLSLIAWLDIARKILDLQSSKSG